MTKNELKYYSSLLQKKFRQRERKFLVEGIKLIQEALNYDYKCEIITVTNSFRDENQTFIKTIYQKKIRTEVLKQTKLTKLSDTKTPQGIIAVFKMPKISSTETFEGSLIVALENINDPGNLGTVIRNCDWFGVKNLFLNENCAEIYSPKVIRASAGSVFHLSIIEEKNFYNTMEDQKRLGYKILCADLNGENIYSFSHGEKNILILANEANGPTNELLAICDSKITIPRIGNAESLNVGSASAILLSELTK